MVYSLKIPDLASMEPHLSIPSDRYCYAVLERERCSGQSDAQDRAQDGDTDSVTCRMLCILIRSTPLSNGIDRVRRSLRTAQASATSCT